MSAILREIIYCSRPDACFGERKIYTSVARYENKLKYKMTGARPVILYLQHHDATTSPASAPKA